MALIETLQDAAEHGAEYGSGVFPPFDTSTFASQLFWLAVTFGLLYLLMSRWVLPKIGGVIEERRDRIADDLDVAATLKTQADDARAALDKALADARAKAHALAAKTRAETDREIAAESAALDAELEAKTKAAQEAITAARAKALKQVRGVAAEAAVTMTERLAGLKPAKKDAEAALAGKD